MAAAAVRMEAAELEAFQAVLLACYRRGMVQAVHPFVDALTYHLLVAPAGSQLPADTRTGAGKGAAEGTGGAGGTGGGEGPPSTNGTPTPATSAATTPAARAMRERALRTVLVPERVTERHFSAYKDKAARHRECFRLRALAESLSVVEYQGEGGAPPTSGSGRPASLLSACLTDAVPLKFLAKYWATTRHFTESNTVGMSIVIAKDLTRQQAAQQPAPSEAVVLAVSGLAVFLRRAILCQQCPPPTRQRALEVLYSLGRTTLRPAVDVQRYQDEGPQPTRAVPDPQPAPAPEEQPEPPARQEQAPPAQQQARRPLVIVKPGAKQAAPPPAANPETGAPGPTPTPPAATKVATHTAPTQEPPPRDLGPATSEVDTPEGDLPLTTPWSLWHIPPAFWRQNQKHNAEAFARALQLKGSFSTVEEFWDRLEDSSVPPLKADMTFYLMRHDWKPTSESPELAGGGSWKLKCTTDEAPVVWSNLILGLVGETLSVGVPEPDSVCGLTWSSRAAFSIWHTNAKCRQQTEAVLRQRLSELLPKLQMGNLPYHRASKQGS